MVDATGETVEDGARPSRSWIGRVLLLVVVVAVVAAFARVYRSVDLDEVWSAMSHLEWWNSIILVGILLLRQVINAVPLAVYIPEVSLFRATVNDLSASTASAFVPPPSDMVLRVTMFSSWGVPVTTAVAGTTVNAMTMFIVRFGTPLAGFVIALLTGATLGLRLLDIASLLMCAVLVTGLLLVVRAEEGAAAIGRFLGGLLNRVRRSVDPEAVATSFRNFQLAISDGFSRRFPRALLATACMVCTDLVLLTTVLRFVGVGPEDIGIHMIAMAFFFAYPLTLFPMQGLGILDTAVTAGILAVTGQDAAEAVVAGLAIWRTITIAGPFLLGGVALLGWRRSRGDRTRAEHGRNVPFGT